MCKPNLICGSRYDNHGNLYVILIKIFIKDNFFFHSLAGYDTRNIALVKSNQIEIKIFPLKNKKKTTVDDKS